MAPQSGDLAFFGVNHTNTTLAKIVSALSDLATEQQAVSQLQSVVSQLQLSNTQLAASLSTNAQLVASLSATVAQQNAQLAQQNAQLTAFACASLPALLQPFQSIPTSGALDWEYFSINNQSYLAVANQFNGTNYSINSQIFKFDGTRFVPFQSIPTSGAADWEYFSINNQSYLALANTQNGTSYNTKSQIFKFNGCLRGLPVCPHKWGT